MAEIGYASLGIIPSFDGFQGKLEGGTSKAMAAAGVTGGQQFGDSAGKSAGSRFTSRIKTVAKIGAATLAGAAAIGFKFAGDAIGEAREAQKVGALTASTIKATGKAANVTAKQVGNLSGKISEKVGIDDEAIQAGANMLLTFKNIRNEAGEGNKIFDQSLRTLTDLSAAMGTDAKSSAIQLGKALNDPVKGITALTRVGVTFTEQQKKQIEQMVKAGDVAGAQKVILRELKSEFGGAAAAQATEADKLTVAWGNFKEEIGTELLPVMDDLAKFLRKKGIPAAKDFIGWIRDKGIPAAKDFAREMKPVLKRVEDLAGFIDDLPKEIKIGIPAGLLALIGYGKLRGGNLGGSGALGTLGKTLGMAKPIPVYVVNKGGLDGGSGGDMGGKKGWIATLAAWGVRRLGPPAAVAAGTTAAHKALGKDAPQMAPGTAGYAGDGGMTLPGHALDFTTETDKAARSLVRANDAASKLPNQMDQGKTAAQALLSKVVDLEGWMRKVEGDKKTRFLAPGFDVLLARTKDYYGLLDGLDNRTINTFIKTTRLKNDIGESGDPRFGGFRANGGTVERGKAYVVGERRPEMFVPNEPGRIVPEVASAGGVRVYVDKVVAHDYGDFMSQVQMRARRAALDGRRPA